MPGLKGSASIRGEDTYVHLRQLLVFITRESSSLASLARLIIRAEASEILSPAEIETYTRIEHF